MQKRKKWLLATSNIRLKRELMELCELGKQIEHRDGPCCVGENGDCTALYWHIFGCETCGRRRREGGRVGKIFRDMTDEEIREEIIASPENLNPNYTLEDAKALRKLAINFDCLAAENAMAAHNMILAYIAKLDNVLEHTPGATARWEIFRQAYKNLPFF